MMSWLLFKLSSFLSLKSLGIPKFLLLLLLPTGLLFADSFFRFKDEEKGAKLTVRLQKDKEEGENRL